MQSKWDSLAARRARGMIDVVGIDVLPGVSFVLHQLFLVDKIL